MRTSLPLSLLLLLLTVTAAAQKVTVSGYVTDANSGERMIDATVYEKESFAGTTTNSYGFFSLTLTAGKNLIVVSYLGYDPITTEVTLTGDTVMNFSLTMSSSEIDAVTVTASRRQSVIESPQMSMIDIPVEKFIKLPVIFGEADVLKVIQLLPGVQSGTEGSTGIYVRGGGPDQNLFLLDGVPVYNASHLFGFMSVFNPDAVKSVQLYKGGFPARYGERLSSVVDIRMKEGNMKELHGNFAIGLISSKLSLEGPIIKDKTSFILSARRTYYDVLAQPFILAMNKDENSWTTGGYYFYDLNAKINHEFSERSRLYLSSYLGRDRAYTRSTDKPNYYDGSYDRYEYKESYGLGWGNIINALRWNYLITNRLFSNTTLTYSKYNFDVTIESSSENLTTKEKEIDYFKYYSGIEDLGAKIDFDWYPASGHSVRFGTGYTWHHFKPGVTTFRYDSMYDDEGIDTIIGDMRVRANELILYAEDNFDISPRIKMNAGIRLSLFNVQDTSYFVFQPRLSLRYLATDDLSFKVSYSKMAQFVHLLTTSTISLPTDLWLPVTRRFEPPISHQVAAGSAFRIPGNLEMTVEAFYKTMDNLIEYKEGAFFGGTGAGWESKVEKGRGWAYGAEVLLEKNYGKLTGWIGYTMSWTYRQFDNLNFGKTFPAKYDRRHDISVALTHKFSERVDAGLVWVFGTGNAATLGVMEYPPQEFTDAYYYYTNVTDFPGRNNYRTPSYHRLDLGVNLHKVKKRGTRTWSFSFYNAYCRLNPFFIYWGSEYHEEPDPNNPGQMLYYTKPVLKKISVFPIIPSVSYSFKF
ncbi:MAG: TonB-dependent receptor [Bacteroidales bacterium]|nr:TonB-dependent receptor [Bacteroidales bacterium]MDT8374322.1 TonB-dependent receptor [Bacteroidales bacterium]